MLERHGLLLAADATLPSVATIVAGEPVHGSWWAHPKSHAIFAASSALARHPDAMAIPLISRKVTFVHRRLWPALLAVAQACEPWQTKGLSPQARALLTRVEQAGGTQETGGGGGRRAGGPPPHKPTEHTPERHGRHRR